jgi:hypothetical protein
MMKSIVGEKRPMMGEDDPSETKSDRDVNFVFFKIQARTRLRCAVLC